MPDDVMMATQDVSQTSYANFTGSLMREHVPTGRFWMALLDAQRAIENPVKNKQADTGKFKFKFADLPAVLEVVRPALNDASILLMQVATELADRQTPTLITRLLHAPSGEWIEMTLPLPRMSDPQDWGKQLSYARRYSVLSCLGIASGDDDNDANKRGTRVIDARPANEPPHLPRVPSAHHQTVLTYAMRGLARTEDVLDLEAALGYWRDHSSDMRWLYGQSEGVASVIEAALDAAVTKVTSKKIANALVAALRAREPSHARVIDERMSGAWGQDIGRLVQISERLHSLVRGFIEGELARFAPEPAAKARLDAPSPPPPQQNVQEVWPDERHEPVPAVVDDAGAGGVEDGPLYALLDQDGEIVEEPTTDPVTFVTSYVNAFSDCADTAMRANIAHHNSEGIEHALRVSKRAAQLYDELMANLRDNEGDYGDLRLEPPMSGGKLMVAAYIAAVRDSVAKLGREGVKAWVAANSPVYNAFPMTVRQMVLAKVIARREQLGMAGEPS